MGAYYDFYGKIRLVKNTPEEVKQIFRDVCKGDSFFGDLTERGEVGLDHPFFKEFRASFVIKGGSGRVETWYKFKESKNGVIKIEFHCAAKYFKEVVFKFLDWIKPYLYKGKNKNYIGWFKGPPDYDMNDEDHYYITREGTFVYTNKHLEGKLEKLDIYVNWDLNDD